MINSAQTVATATGHTGHTYANEGPSVSASRTALPSDSVTDPQLVLGVYVDSFSGAHTLAERHVYGYNATYV
jgi:hypothetical protein